MTAVESQDANWISPFEAGGNLTIDGDFGGVWFTLNGATNAVAGDELRVLLGQFTTGGSISGQISLQVFPEGNGDEDLIMTFPIGNSSCGCTDVEACNYSDLATNDDGSCSYPGVLDCDGETCVNDSDQDGICDELEVPGCDDVTAINYQDAASDNDGSCLYLGCMDSNADNYDAGANVEGDCTYPAEGCTDSEAANYDDSALIDDGSCLYVGCMDPEADNYDSAANVEGFCEYPAEGCTDSEAANFSDSALIDDGSCLYPGCTDSTALNYDPEANFDSGCILPMEGCTDPMAENYNALANTNDGTCEYTPPCPGDLNGDGTININDLLDFFQIYGSGLPGVIRTAMIPKPTVLFLRSSEEKGVPIRVPLSPFTGRYLSRHGRRPTQDGLRAQLDAHHTLALGVHVQVHRAQPTGEDRGRSWRSSLPDVAM